MAKPGDKFKNSVELTEKTFFLMTGASRGIGRTIAIECAAKMATGSVIVLIARTTAGLEETKAQILAKNPSNVTVFYLALDLTNPTAEQIQSVFEATLNERNLGEFKLAMIVHNVGSLGNVTQYAKHLTDIDKWQEYFALNVYSVIALNGEFLKRFAAVDCRRLVVNITSKCGLVPFKSLTMYCSGKAAREMYFRSLAIEEETVDPQLVVLNYAPGPVQTEMTADIESNAVSPELRDLFKGMRTDRTMLQPIDTTMRFIAVIEQVSVSLLRESKDFDFSHDIDNIIMDSAFGRSFLFLTKLAWNCKVTLPVLVTAVFLAMDFRMQIELNIESEQVVFQDEIDDDSEYESETTEGDDPHAYFDFSDYDTEEMEDEEDEENVDEFVAGNTTDLEEIQRQ